MKLNVIPCQALTTWICCFHKNSALDNFYHTQTFDWISTVDVFWFTLWASVDVSIHRYEWTVGLISSGALGRYKKQLIHSFKQRWMNWTMKELNFAGIHLNLTPARKMSPFRFFFQILSVILTDFYWKYRGLHNVARCV